MNNILQQNGISKKQIDKLIEKINRFKGYAYINGDRLRLQKTSDISSYLVFEINTFDNSINMFFGDKGYKKITQSEFIAKIKELLNE